MGTGERAGAGSSMNNGASFRKMVGGRTPGKAPPSSLVPRGPCARQVSLQPMWKWQQMQVVVPAVSQELPTGGF